MSLEQAMLGYDYRISFSHRLFLSLLLRTNLGGLDRMRAWPTFRLMPGIDSIQTPPLGLKFQHGGDYNPSFQVPAVMCAV